MEPTVPLKINFRQILDTLKTYRWFWIVPAVVMTFGALVIGIVMPSKWLAVQSYLVRDEAGNNLRGLGKFDSNEAMKTAQETIQELARHRSSVESVLKLIGPPEKYKNPDQWPTADNITSAQTAISVVAPNGTEFGKTEVIHVSSKGESKERAVQLTKAVGDELEKRLREFRHQKLRSIVEEMEKRARVSETERDAASRRLQAFEARIGGDVGDLRSFTESNEGGSSLRNQQVAIRNDMRQANTQRESLLQLQELIEAARKDPGNFLATPSRLLDAQPGLKKIKEALVDMQAQRAKLAGMMSPNHPRVQEAAYAEQEMRDGMHRELKESSRGVESDLKANAAQIKSLEMQLAQVNKRLDELAGSRTEYVNLVSDLKRCSETLEKTNRELSDARAALSGALSASLISRLEGVIAGDRPIGPSLTVIVFGGLSAGLATGLGLVFLIAPIGPTGRRLTDLLPIGRRASDRGPTRRANDPPPIAPAPTPAPAVPRGRRTYDPLPPLLMPNENRRAEDAIRAQKEADKSERERRQLASEHRAPDQPAPQPTTATQTSSAPSTPPAAPITFPSLENMPTSTNTLSPS